MDKKHSHRRFKIGFVPWWTRPLTSEWLEDFLGRDMLDFGDDSKQLELVLHLHAHERPPPHIHCTASPGLKAGSLQLQCSPKWRPRAGVRAETQLHTGSPHTAGPYAAVFVLSLTPLSPQPLVAQIRRAYRSTAFCGTKLWLTGHSRSNNYVSLEAADSTHSPSFLRGSHISPHSLGERLPHWVFASPIYRSQVTLECRAPFPSKKDTEIFRKDRKT